MTPLERADMVLAKKADGTVHILGPVPRRLVVACEVLEKLDPDVAVLTDEGSNTFLTILGHRFRLVAMHHPIDCAEFVRVDP